MDKTQILKQLNEAKATIDSTIKWVKESPDPVQAERVEVGTCLECKLPIYADEETTRGIHNACYHLLYAEYVRPGLKTLEELEVDGRVGPPGKSGRKGRRAKADAEAYRAKKKRPEQPE